MVKWKNNTQVTIIPNIIKQSHIQSQTETFFYISNLSMIAMDRLLIGVIFHDKEIEERKQKYLYKHIRNKIGQKLPC